MSPYTLRSRSQLQGPASLRKALERLLVHTATRVRDGVRSVATLQMQEAHAAWMLDQVELPEELGIGASLGDVELRTLTTPVIAALLEWWHAAGGEGGRSLNIKTVAKRKSTLRRALVVAVEDGVLERVPEMPEIGLPPLRPRMRILRNYAELRLLCSALSLRRAEWVQLAVWTCQRPGDTERMCWSDVDLRSATPSMIIRSTKTRRPHGVRVKVPGPLVSVLADKLTRLETAGTSPAPRDPIVDAWPGVSKVLPVVCVRLGLPPMSAMDLRHTGFSWMVRRVGLTRAAQEWGGWSDFNMLSKYYAHALPAGLEQAADELASIALEEPANDGAPDPMRPANDGTRRGKR